MAVNTMTANEPAYASGKKGKEDSLYYSENIDKYLIPETRHLLENYSHIPPEEVSDHVHKIRDLAWSVRSYPCTGLGLFLTPTITRSLVYKEIVSRLLRSDPPARFLDVGCFVGHDLRCLAGAGVPADRLYGVDIVNHWDIGYSLFRDGFGDGSQFVNAHFVEADILASPPSSQLTCLDHSFEMISITHVLHQWRWHEQFEVCKRLVRLATGPGAIIVGFHIGNQNASERRPPAMKDHSQYRHNGESFAKLWREVGDATDTRWETQAELRSWEYMGWDPADLTWQEKGAGVLEFVARRVP